MKFINIRITGRFEQEGNCGWRSFREQILSILPQLQVLDGEMLMHHEDEDDDDKSEDEEDMEGHDADGETDEQDADVSGELINHEFNLTIIHSSDASKT